MSASASQIDVNEAHPLSGKIALITGCTGGIGTITAKALARRGCSIAVHYHSAADKAAELVSELEKIGAVAGTSVRSAAFQADLGVYDNVRKMHSEVVSKLGHPDILYNNGAATGTMIGPQGDIQDVSIEEFESTWKVNTGSSYLLTQLCLPHMEAQKYGRIIFCSSVAAGTGGVVGPHYASSKSALHGMLHWVAQRYAKEGITCNAVAPALIINTNMMSIAPKEHINLIPVGRFGQSEDIASVVELLVLNSYMTNKIIVADGGMTGTGF